jgi:hypothetical protein
VEIPLTTVLIMHSILDIARSEGADISASAVKRECLNVFAFGGPNVSDDAVDTSYYAARIALLKGNDQIAALLVRKAGDALAVYAATLAPRYAPVVAEKLIAQSAPIVGALGGAAINVLFTDHFQDKAHGHFTVLRLEGVYGPDPIRTRYSEILEEGRRPLRRPGRAIETR